MSLRRSMLAGAFAAALFAQSPTAPVISARGITNFFTQEPAPGTVGLVTALGWYLTKHAIGVYATSPPSRPWGRPRCKACPCPGGPASAGPFGSTPINGHRQTASACWVGADFVAKVI